MVKIIAICSLLACLSGCAAPPGEFVPYYQVATQKPYDDVLSELEVAISENNFRITGHSRVGKVIRERGPKDFPDYDTIQFCNLTHARTILEISPEAIRHMPCNVVMYQHQGKTVVRTHLLPTDTGNEELNRFSEQMNRTLKKIVDFAVEN
jgi:uncharacterized protein (DUF302 family)